MVIQQQPRAPTIHTPLRVRVGIAAWVAALQVKMCVGWYLSNVVWGFAFAADQDQNLTDVHTITTILAMRHIVNLAKTSPTIGLLILGGIILLISATAWISYASLHAIYKRVVARQTAIYSGTLYVPGVRPSEKGHYVMDGNTTDLAEENRRQVQELTERVDELAGLVRDLRKALDNEDGDDDEQASA
jgi:hypothetical protein